MSEDVLKVQRKSMSESMEKSTAEDVKRCTDLFKKNRFELVHALCYCQKIPAEMWTYVY